MFRKYTDEKTYEKIVDFKSVAEMFNHSVSEYSDKIAITDDCKEYSYKALEEEVAKFRTVLKTKGIKKGDRVGLLSVNSIDFVKSYLAIVSMGGVALLLPPQLDEMTVYGCTLKFSLKALVYFEGLSEKLSIIKAKNPNFILVSTNETSNELTDAENLQADDDCAILFTGGTTGKSKGALLTNGAVMQGTKNGCFGLKEIFNERYLLVLPLTHVFGLIRNLMTSLYTGSNLYICRNNKNMFQDIAVFKPTVLVLVPALAEMALNLSKQFGRNMLGDSLKYIICGAAPVPPYLVSEYKKQGVVLLPGYGLTESANLVSGNPEVDRKPDSVGIPYENQELKIVDGELWLKGKNMMKCYVGDEEENKNAFVDGWFRTGDLARIDDEGFLYIIGRTKEIIVLSSGENVSPAEVEAKFNELSIIQDCLLYLKDNQLVLEVVPRAVELNKREEADKQKLILDELQKVNQKLLSFERVQKFIIRETDFKRSPSMKILRNVQ